MHVAVVLAVATCVLFALPFAAWAYNEISTGYPNPPSMGSNLTYCYTCHGPYSDGSNGCLDCHGPPLFGLTPQFGKGPHNGYTTGSQRCEICHTIHDAQGDFALLPQATVSATCATCHDGTGGKGVYGTIAARTGHAPGAQHRIDVTSVVPGGDAATGGSLSTTFTGPSGTMTCTDCHNPHDANTVAPFVGDRLRVPYSIPSRQSWQIVSSDRLLRKHPGGSTTTVAEYGSDWCLACHKGRMSQGTVYNHPVDSKSQRADSFTYQNLALLVSDASTTQTVLGTLGGSNRGYLMPDPRTAVQGTHAPICQQCHSDTRSTVGTMTGSSASAATFAPSLDGTLTTGNPRFQNFPHETENAKLLVETGDTLCTNCHQASTLP